MGDPFPLPRGEKQAGSILRRRLLLAGVGVAATARPMAALAAAGASALRKAADTPELRRIYSAARWRPLWSPAAASALDAAFAVRNRHGLERIALLPEPTPLRPAARDVGLTRAALAYASALSRGWVDPATLHEVYTLPRPHSDLASGLVNALSSDRLEPWLDSLAP